MRREADTGEARDMSGMEILSALFVILSAVAMIRKRESFAVWLEVIAILLTLWGKR